MAVSLSLTGEELRDESTDVPGGRKKMSAPVPRARRADSCNVPLLTPTSVRIMVTSTAMARMLNAVRTGRGARLAKVSLLSNQINSNGYRFIPLRFQRGEYRVPDLCTVTGRACS